MLGRLITGAASGLLAAAIAYTKRPVCDYCGESCHSSCKAAAEIFELERRVWHLEDDVERHIESYSHSAAMKYKQRLGDALEEGRKLRSCLEIIAGDWDQISRRVMGEMASDAIDCEGVAVVDEPPRQQFCIATKHGESWTEGPLDSLEEAQKTLARYRAEDDDDDDFRIYRVREIDGATYLPGVDELCEYAEERAYDDGCGVDESPRHIVSDSDREKAQAELDAWARRWIEVDGHLFVGAEVKEELEVSNG